MKNREKIPFPKNLKIIIFQTLRYPLKLFKSNLLLIRPIPLIQTFDHLILRSNLINHHLEFGIK